MGSCVSVHKSSQESAMKLGLFIEPKTDSLIIPPSPVKEKPAAANGHFALESQSSSTFKDLGSKDETFFDSRAYLDSDCEDDFVSVNGDFTPPHSNTPVHRSFFVGTSQVNKVGDDGSPGSVSETSPSGKKKKLVELFQESIRDDHDTTEPNTSSNQDTATEKIVKPTIQDILPPKSVDGTPYVSGANSCCSSERTVNGDNPIFKEKPLRSVQCCLPSLVSCSSFSERKKKMSPAIAANDKP
ncbi:putative -like protein [Gossypium arboreum]|uniref:Putative-like protein n=6 Tax=Gossypium TaxID=3633 RepID=A0A0B0NPX1_GOSAR|nr:uncharacterized protein At3g27210-like [Gossypium hirsutum]KAB2084785.1 hypothetical protein ES319_A05G357500v1 [Gossypium barbadense]KHG13136.1 putative -like protein [Gossypium arboreum]TYH19756.1 hypothetical protein ES288_A05G377600v1 [Gossypium darwinii]TYI30360.1 hypothetical protein ES332_A05G382000v1 [Gossypium tomentosum]TYJ37325.1 hypothetical protein E1A91_A05G368200v1 [Gossypium mustelinum]